MKESIRFLNMFAQYDAPADLQTQLAAAEIVSADIDQAARVIDVKIYCPAYISEKSLAAVSTDICGCYGLTALNIFATFPPDQLQRCARTVSRTAG